MNDTTKLIATTPYIGIRAYGVEDSPLFAGRDADVASVADLIADKDRWRLIILHGLTGAGKSSFLKAGLIPEVTSAAVDTAVFIRRQADPSYSLFITSTDDPMRRLAETAIELVYSSVPAEEIEEFYKSIKWYGKSEWTEENLARSASQLAAFFSALAPRLNRPLLLIVDQAEELFTIRSGEDAEQSRECYFDFLAEFCGRSSWIQLLLSMRTEFYGRFDSELRRRLGPTTTVAPYFLRSLTAPILEQVIVAPCEFTFVTNEGAHYLVRYESGLPKRIATDLERDFPGPGALTCLQIVCSQLAERALTECSQSHEPKSEDNTRIAYISSAMYNDLGSPTDAIEDVIDQALGDFCDSKGLIAFDAMMLWKAAKRVLGSLVVKQAEGAPVTTFVLYDGFVTDMQKQIMELMPRGVELVFPGLYSFGSFQGSNPRRRTLTRNSEDLKRIIENLVSYLLAPESRILRTLKVGNPDGKGTSHFLALGHDVLAVGIAEFNARDDWIDHKSKLETRMLMRKVVAIPLFTSLLTFNGLSLLKYFDKVQMSIVDILLRSGAVAVATVYVIGFYSAFIDIRNDRVGRNSIGSFLRREQLPPLYSKSVSLRLLAKIPAVRLALTRLPKSGRLFREFTARDRQRHSLAGHSAFPGGPRY